MADQPNEPQAPPAPKPRRRGRPVRWIVFAVVLVAAVIGGRMLWSYLESYEDTDDAQIDGNIYAITSRIAGTVKAVYVEDNQQVKTGQVLVELDPSDYSVSVEQAKAALNESRSQVLAARPNIPIRTTTTGTSVSSFESEIAAARAQVAAAQRDYESAIA
jgi:membrane fusion protein, multidrug efflux system